NRVESAIENAADVGRAYVDLASGNLGDEVQAMAEDLNAAERGLTEDRARYEQFLQLQAQRRELTSARVIDRSGSPLAGEEFTDPAISQPPSAEAFTAADQGSVSLRFDQQNDRLVALYRLTEYDNAYVYVSKAIEPGLVTQLRAFDQAVVD